MTAASLNLELRSALMVTGLVQPVQHSEDPKHFWVLCRLVPGQETAWLQVVEELLRAYPEGPDVLKKLGAPEVVIARRYVLKDDVMVFGWHIGIVAKKLADLKHVIDLFKPILENARPALTPVYRQALAPTFEEQPPTQPLRLAPGQHPPRRQGGTPRHPAAEDLADRPGQTPPPGFQPSLRTVSTGHDEKGRVTMVQEMPLPHVYKDLNVPNAKGRGAKTYGG